ncbi:cytidine deaminase-like protein [Apodospora peruviana]|uniref:Cytosine deaminase n=1 Tax=Apodospora peruviana TaxID=516989 RepID=A0AAE0IR85_9PEZI|nr:cytidine deaminase-like protein [Apodospora peruviana]
MDDAAGLAIAFEEAQASYDEGGIPCVKKWKTAVDGCAEPSLTRPRFLLCTQIGAALVDSSGKLLGRGHNMRVQLGSAIHHGETSALFNSGRLPAKAYKGSTMYTTLSPCDMCTGACLLYGIARVVIGENRNFIGGEAYLKQRGVEVVVLDDDKCRTLMDKFIAEKPDVWNEDIGVEERVYSKE